jgi:hypothetical protein
MSVCLFLNFQSGLPIESAEIRRLEEVLATAPKLRKALLHTSSHAHDPYVKDGAPPAVVLQLSFAELPELEGALARAGHLAILTSHQDFPVLAKANVTQQAMMARSFPVPVPGTPGCTYLVSYEGEAEDLNAWLGHYLDSHTRHMARFPSIRELEVYTRLDWVSALPWLRVHFMQRNKVAFDDTEALTAALNSPVRHEMRADYSAFPRFTGPVTHYPMATRVVHLRSQR